jgi:hypothetical protein
VTPGTHGPAVPGVQGLDRVGGGQDPAYLDVEREERGELLPGRPPQLRDRRIRLTPLLLQLLKRRPRRLDTWGSPRSVDTLLAGLLVPPGGCPHVWKAAAKELRPGLPS